MRSPQVRFQVWATCGVLAAVLAATFGCDKKSSPEQQPSPTRSSPLPAASSAPTVVPPPGAASSTKPEAKRPATPEERAAFERYQAALGRGRLATQRKQWAKARAAFDEALGILPNDPRALAERGYAKLLEDDLDGAQRDFEAVSGIADDKLWAQVWFNRGLIQEKRGHGDAALEAFAMSNSLNATKAAADKLRGKSLCPVVTRHSTGTRYASWMEFWTKLVAPVWSKYNEPAKAPKDDAGVIRELTTGKCDPVCIARVVTDEDFYHVVAPGKDGSVLVFPNVLKTLEYRCGGSPRVEVGGGNPARVDFLTINDEYTVNCAPGTPPGEPCMTGCLNGTWIAVSAFVDVPANKMLRIEQTGLVGEDDDDLGVRPLSLEGGGVKAGEGCRFPL